MPHSCCDLLNYTLNPNKTGMNYANNHRPMVKRKSLPLHSTDSKLFVSIFLRYIWGPKMVIVKWMRLPYYGSVEAYLEAV